MRALRVTRGSLRPMLRIVLLLTSLLTYLVSPDDVVWRLIKFTPRARLLEHTAFGIAAVFLGTALVFNIRASTFKGPSSAQTTIGSLLQAIGIGFLLPLPGFLLFVSGELLISLLLGERQPASREALPVSQTRSLPAALAEHIGLCCAFLSMIVFSIVLIDRVADALFATSALISLLASSGRALPARPGR